MSTVTTTYLRENLSDIIQSVVDGEEIIVRLGRGKKAKMVKLSSFQPKNIPKRLPKNHSLLKFVNSNYYKNLPVNQLSNIKDLKKYHKENFLKGTFEERYGK